MQNSDSAWRLLGWGLGEFQHYELHPVLRSSDGRSLLLQLEEPRERAREGEMMVALTPGEAIEVGVIISNIQDNKSSLDVFNQSKHRLRLELELCQSGRQVDAQLSDTPESSGGSSESIQQPQELSPYRCRTANALITSVPSLSGNGGHATYYIWRQVVMHVPSSYCYNDETKKGENGSSSFGCFSMKLRLSVCTMNYTLSKKQTGAINVNSIAGHATAAATTKSTTVHKSEFKINQGSSEKKNVNNSDINTGENGIQSDDMTRDQDSLLVFGDVSAGSNEKQVRMLLDSHRFQPPKIPQREMIICPVYFINPLLCVADPLQLFVQ